MSELPAFNPSTNPGGKQVSAFPEGASFQTPFSRDKQVRFLEALALWGGVRAACRAVPASPQTVYRHRRASHDFALAWDAALLVARPQVEDVLGDRALNGIEEVIYYHGEEIGRRRRYDSRLLLAHLARLDQADESEEVHSVAGDFDAALERLRRGEPVDPHPDDDDDDDVETVTYGERWEDERLPFPERAELYQRWLEAEDDDAEDGEGDALPDPYDCGAKKKPFDAAKYVLRQRSDDGAENSFQDRVTPVTLQHDPLAAPAPAPAPT